MCLRLSHKAVRFVVERLVSLSPPDHLHLVLRDLLKPYHTGTSMPPEIILLMGPPAAGKTTYAQQLDPEHYLRAQDPKPEALAAIFQRLQTGLSVVVEGAFPRRSDRLPLLQWANLQNVSVLCKFLRTSLEDVLVNACCRMMDRLGRILRAHEETDDPEMFPVSTVYRYFDKLEMPATGEGFTHVEIVPFRRKPWPEEWKNRALILDYDATLRTTTPEARYDYPTQPEEVVVLPGRREVLDSWQQRGYLLLGVSNQSGIARQTLTRESCVDCFEETGRQLGLCIDYRFDETLSPPMVSYRRKPNPGMGIELIYEYRLHPSQCILVGDDPRDHQMAQTCGFEYHYPDDFFRN